MNTQRHSHITELTSSSLTSWGRMCGYSIVALFCAWEDDVRLENGYEMHSGRQCGIDCTFENDMFWNSSSPSAHAHQKEFPCRIQTSLDLVTTPNPHLLLVHHLHLEPYISSHPHHFFSARSLPYSLAHTLPLPLAQLPPSAPPSSPHPSAQTPHPRLTPLSTHIFQQ